MKEIQLGAVVRGQDWGDLQQPTFPLAKGSPHWNMVQKRLELLHPPEREDSGEVHETRLDRLEAIQDSLGAAM